jgi:hypothetical protein
MAIPLQLSKEALDSSEFQQFAIDEIKNRTEGVHFDSVQPFYLCYQGPCVNGRREVCYNYGNGCVSCGYSTSGC